MNVMGRWSVRSVKIRAGGTGLYFWRRRRCWRWSPDPLGLRGGLRDALADVPERQGGHDPGLVLCDLR